MSNRFLGSVGLISGTAIGAAMLAMPVTTAPIGWFPSLFVLIAMAALMVYSGLLILESLARMPADTTMISMAGETLGPGGRLLAMLSYLFLLFSLNASYLGLAGDLLRDFFLVFYFNLDPLTIQIVLLAIFGLFMASSVERIDLFNRFLVLGMIVCYIALNVLIVPHLNAQLLTRMQFAPLLSTLPVVLTSFGYHPIIPNIYNYLGRDVQQTKKAIIWGTLLPLFVYAFWQMAVHGTVSYEGDLGLKEAYSRSLSATTFLVRALKAPLLSYLALGFSLFAIMTSFLGTFMGMVDFLIDAFQVEKNALQKTVMIVMASLPLLLVNVFMAKIFMVALGFAGLMTSVLIGLLPILMTYQSRRIHRLEGSYLVAGGEGMMLFASLLFVMMILIELGWIK